MEQSRQYQGASSGWFEALFWGAFVIGWVLNIVKLVGADSITGMVMARFAGIFVFPLGAILGWL